jgi:hypothetical protein
MRRACGAGWWQVEGGREAVSGKWRCETCVASSRFESGPVGAIPEQMAPHEPPEGPPPLWPRRIPYQHLLFARDEATRWGRVPLILDTVNSGRSARPLPVGPLHEGATESGP